MFPSDPSSGRLEDPPGRAPDVLGGRALHLHTTVVSAILIFGALFLLTDHRAVASATPGTPGWLVYVLGPLAASAYLTVVLLAVRLLWPTPLRSFYELVGLAGSVALTAGLLTVSLAALAGGPAASLVRPPAFFALSLLGVTVPLLSLGLRPARDSTFPFTAVAACVLPVPLALAVGLPNSTPYGTVDLAIVVLVISAILFQIAGVIWSQRLGAVSGPAGARPSRLAFLRRWPSVASRLSRRNRRATAAGTAPPSPPSLPEASDLPRRSRWPDVVSTGLVWLDELLLGGLPRRGQVALWTYGGPGPDAVVATTLNEGLRRGECVVLVTASASVTEVAELLERLGPGFCEHDREGRVFWVDASGRRRSLAPSPVAGPADHVQILQELRAMLQEADSRSPRGFCVGFLGLTSVVRTKDSTAGVAFIRNATAILDRYPALSLFSLDRIRPADPAATTLIETTDGTLAFRTEADRTFLRVLGLSPVETREWVECRFRARSDPLSDRVGESDPYADRIPPAPVAVTPSPPPPIVFRPGAGLAASFEPSTGDKGEPPSIGELVTEHPDLPGPGSARKGGP